jgi:hypothetical protein
MQVIQIDAIGVPVVGAAGLTGGAAASDLGGRVPQTLGAATSDLGGG